MRITQGYVSKSVMDFPFHQIYSLDDYNDWCEPSVFFGMYRYEDFRMVTQHLKGHRIIFWTGQDALNFDHWYFLHQESNWISNVTAHPKVHELILSKGVECTLVPPSSFLNEPNPRQLGPRIYAYCPSSYPEYHRYDLLVELRQAGYNVVIGDGQIPQDKWQYSKEAFYGDICVGLCLSEFAGGGTSTIEMGLRGVKVITNVFNLPNCIPWSGDAQDIAGLINEERRKIGTTNEQLAQDVYASLDHEFNWLNI